MWSYFELTRKEISVEVFQLFLCAFFGSCMSHNENRLLNITKKIYTLSNRHSALIISLLQYWCYKNNIKGIFGHFRWIRSLIFKRSFSFYLSFPVYWHKCCSLNSTIVAYIEWLLFLIKQKCYRENTAISDNYF